MSDFADSFSSTARRSSKACKPRSSPDRQGQSLLLRDQARISFSSGCIKIIPTAQAPNCFRACCNRDAMAKVTSDSVGNTNGNAKGHENAMVRSIIVATSTTSHYPAHRREMNREAVGCARFICPTSRLAIFTNTNSFPPTRIDIASLDKSMNGGMWPFGRVFKLPMLHRVDVNIVHVVCEILIIASQMFSETALLDATFLLHYARWSNVFCLRQHS